MRYNINEYERTHGLYMMFSVKNNEIHAYKEGEKGNEYLLRGDNLNRYMAHLNKSIEHLIQVSNFFNGNDYKINKQLEKYQLYKKRLDNATSKIIDSNEVAI